MRTLVVIFLLFFTWSAGYCGSILGAYGFLSHSAPGKTIKAENWPYQKIVGLNLFGAGFTFNPSPLESNFTFFQTNYATAYDVHVGLRRDVVGFYYGKRGALTTNDKHEFLSPQYFGVHFDGEWDRAAFRIDGQYGFGSYTHIHPDDDIPFFNIEEKKEYSTIIVAPQFSYNVISKLNIVLSMGFEKYSFLTDSNFCWNIGLVFGDSFFRFYNATRSLKYKTPDTQLFRKPNIYLYPETAMQVDVTLDPKGYITTSIPEYNNGWSVWAEPSGRLDETYDFLFYEAEVPYIKPNEGWCVSADNLEFFFIDILQRYGFNAHEIDDFFDYWLSILNDAPFYDIRPLLNQDIELFCPIEIIPQPESMLRLWFLFTPRQNYINLSEPAIPFFDRSGFYVTEWGGALLP